MVFKDSAADYVGIVVAGLFGSRSLTMSSHARRFCPAAQNTLPLDINAAMTQRVQPTIFALGHRLDDLLAGDDRAVYCNLYNSVSTVPFTIRLLASAMRK